ncbi:uncharacterized protein GGS22DRAFT_154830 [Annulohypoxylon maeteangense]|uniref:uncharacterized protein n=1 Tax=Annulohypoxylon maeteangense TaxID=1927788 RepID=UPI0020073C15|nr:uncharacterized protein GGS22DRAFT_154830 [Annulohypoxylon maeteangense]KAI0888011.1 hypothetical protein GGS22DRAFT_154830 [Annulohypoxylon maeteangense]
MKPWRTPCSRASIALCFIVVIAPVHEVISHRGAMLDQVSSPGSQSRGSHRMQVRHSSNSLRSATTYSGVPCCVISCGVSSLRRN